MTLIFDFASKPNSFTSNDVFSSTASSRAPPPAPPSGAIAAPPGVPNSPGKMVRPSICRTMAPRMFTSSSGRVTQRSYRPCNFGEEQGSAVAPESPLAPPFSPTAVVAVAVAASEKHRPRCVCVLQDDTDRSGGNGNRNSPDEVFVLVLAVVFALEDKDKIPTLRGRIARRPVVVVALLSAEFIVLYPNQQPMGFLRVVSCRVGSGRVVSWGGVGYRCVGCPLLLLTTVFQVLDRA
mmetsp:Transcript_18116/g.37661  ORF Transcript_18116/g.37661 Transcript_18116/m.37661 type:complete len:236 (-) Transcript_18116:481-1188(-)